MDVYIVVKCMRGWIHPSLFHVGAYVTRRRRLERGNYSHATNNDAPLSLTQVFVRPSIGRLLSLN
jgi:hypothetical protein